MCLDVALVTQTYEAWSQSDRGSLMWAFEHISLAKCIGTAHPILWLLGLQGCDVSSRVSGRPKRTNPIWICILFCHFPIVVSYLYICQNPKIKPNLVVYLVWRSKIFVSVATLSAWTNRTSFAFAFGNEVAMAAAVQNAEKAKINRRESAAWTDGRRKMGLEKHVRTGWLHKIWP